jgi:ribosomal protein L30E
MTSSS